MEGGQQLCQESPYNDTGCYGGHARVATVCKQAKAANPATLCIDAGDEFLGTAWDVLFEGQQTGPALAAAGVAKLASFIHSLTFPMLGGCNMDTTAEPSLNIKKWHVFDVEGRKVALLGYIAGDTGALTSAGAVRFSDPVTAVPSCLADFKAAPDSAGVDIIGLVSHAGLSVDEKVAGAVTDVDFIVSAHSHTQMYPGLLGPCLEFADGTCQARDDSELDYPLIVAGTPILQQYYASKYVGVSTLTFSDSGALISITGKPIALGTSYDADGVPSTVAEDEAVVALLADQFEQVVQFSATVIGALPEPGLSAARPDIRNKEMAIGNAVCDAMLASLRDTGFQESPEAPLVCLTNGGGIRAGLPGGAVTFGDVTAVLPFGNFIEVLSITGADLNAALAFGFDSAHNTMDPPGKFPHLGGSLSAVLDYSTGASNTTVASAQYNCEDIADDAVFHLATNNFLAGGGDGYEVFAALPRVLSFGPSLADALADYLDNNTPEGGVAPEDAFDLEGRIAPLNSAESGTCFGAPGAGDAGHARPGSAPSPSAPRGSAGTRPRRPRRPRPSDPARDREASRRRASGKP